MIGGVLGDHNVALILGDNIFYGHGLATRRSRDNGRPNAGATVFAYWVGDPERYGVVDFDSGRENLFYRRETPNRLRTTRSPAFISTTTGVHMAAELEPSPRGELEITDINNQYLKQGEAHRADPRTRVRLAGHWDTPGSLQQAASFIETVQERQGLQIAVSKRSPTEWGTSMRRPTRQVGPTRAQQRLRAIPALLLEEA